MHQAPAQAMQASSVNSGTLPSVNPGALSHNTQQSIRTSQGGTSHIKLRQGAPIGVKFETFGGAAFL